MQTLLCNSSRCSLTCLASSYWTALQEIEAIVASLVERGVVAESEIVAALQAVLPEQFQQLVPRELRNVVPQSPATVQQQAQEGFYEEPPLSAEQLSISQSGKSQLHHSCSKLSGPPALCTIADNSIGMSVPFGICQPLSIPLTAFLLLSSQD